MNGDMQFARVGDYVVAIADQVGKIVVHLVDVIKFAPGKRDVISLTHGRDQAIETIIDIALVYEYKPGAGDFHGIRGERRPNCQVLENIVGALHPNPAAIQTRRGIGTNDRLVGADIDIAHVETAIDDDHCRIVV